MAAGLVVAIVALTAGGCAARGRSLVDTAAPSDSLSLHDRAVFEQRQLLLQQERVDVVARRLLEALPASTPGDSVLYVGLRLADPGSDAEDAVLADAVGVTSPVRPYVISVDPSGPAAESDVLPGDQVLAVADEPVRRLSEVQRALHDADPAQPVRLRLFRAGQQHELEVAGGWRHEGLDVRVVADDELVNAFARRQGIVLPTGMLRFLRNEHELAIVLGHEIGHVVRSHLTGIYARGRFDPRFARDLEREADRFGLELVDRAGYNPAAGITLWERFGAIVGRPFGREWLATHPPSRERVVLARRVTLQLRPAQILRAILPRLPISPFP